MGTDDFDELAPRSEMVPPRDRNTDPAPPETLAQQIATMQEQFAAMAAKVDEIHAETAGLSKAFHTVNGHLSALRADSYMAIEQLQPIGKLIGELDARLTRLDEHVRDLDYRVRHSSPPSGDTL